MSKRRIMRTLKIEEIAGVDRPAQAPAKALLMKRDENKPAGKSGGGQEPNEETEMTDAEKAAQEALLKAEKDQVAALKAELEVAKATALLSDAEKAHMTSLDEVAKKAFLASKPEERQVAVAKATEANPVVYKDEEGAEYRKNDDPRLVATAKRADAAVKAARLSEEKAERTDLEKRAGVLLKNLPGETDVKVALLKAVDGIKDEAIRAKAVELLKANGEKLDKAFEERGTAAGRAASVNDQLETMAKKYATDNKVDMVKARVAILDTDEGRALYAKTLSPAAA